MLPPVQSQLTGFEEAAAVALRALLLPDGSVSHYEVEARNVEGELVAFEARGDGGIPIDDGKLGLAMVRFRTVLLEFSHAMR